MNKCNHSKKLLVYICSPYSGDIEGNTKKARRYCRFAVIAGAVPLAPHLLLPQFMSDKRERKLAMKLNMVFLERCDELWVVGPEITEGMKEEIDRAKDRGIPVRHIFRKRCSFLLNPFSNGGVTNRYPML